MGNKFIVVWLNEGEMFLKSKMEDEGTLGNYSELLITSTPKPVNKY
jgi:hypothetical protein